MRQYTKAIYSACLELFQSNVEDGRTVVAARKPRLASVTGTPTNSSGEGSARVLMLLMLLSAASHLKWMLKL